MSFRGSVLTPVSQSHSLYLQSKSCVLQNGCRSRLNRSILVTELEEKEPAKFCS